MNTVLEIIIDYSNSMGRFSQNGISYLLSDGSTRMELAKKALVDDIIPALNYSGKIGIRRFYSGANNKVIIEDIYVGDFLMEIVLDKIRTLPDPLKTGGTPISQALQNSIDYLKKYSGFDRKIVLVTDGEETDGGDFRVTAESAMKDHGIDYSLFIVGIGQNAETAAKCQNLCEATKGVYVSLETKNYDKVALSSALRPLAFKAVSSTISNIQNSTEKILNPIRSVATEVHEKDQVLKNEIVEVLRAQSRSVELLNKQIINLDNGLKIVSKNLDQSSQKLQDLNLVGSIKDLQNTFEIRFEQIEQNTQKAYAELKEKLQGMIKTYDSLSFENRFGILGGKLDVIQSEISQAFSDIKLRDSKAFELASRQAKETKFWKMITIVSLFVLFGILICLLFISRKTIF